MGALLFFLKPKRSLGPVVLMLKNLQWTSRSRWRSGTNVKKVHLHAVKRIFCENRLCFACLGHLKIVLPPSCCSSQTLLLLPKCSGFQFLSFCHSGLSIILLLCGGDNVKPCNSGLIHQSEFFHHCEVFHYFDG